MKIIGGSFGTRGSAYISSDRCLVVEAFDKKVYPPGSATGFDAKINKSKNFGIFGFLIGSVVLGVALGIFFGVIGFLLGVIVAAAGSFYTTSQDQVEIEFSDGKKILLSCTPRGVKKLAVWANKAR